MATVKPSGAGPLTSHPGGGAPATPSHVTVFFSNGLGDRNARSGFLALSPRLRSEPWRLESPPSAP